MLLPRPIGLSLTLGAGACEQRAPLIPSHNNPTRALGQTVPLYRAGERHHITWVKPSSPAPHLTQPTFSKTTLHLPCSVALRARGCSFHPHLLPVPADVGASRCLGPPSCAMISMLPAEGYPGSTSVTQRGLQGLLPPWVLQSPLLHPPIPLIFKLRLSHILSPPFLSTPSPGDSSPPSSLSVYTDMETFVHQPGFPSNSAQLLDGLLHFCSCCSAWPLLQPLRELPAGDVPSCRNPAWLFCSTLRSCFSSFSRSQAELCCRGRSACARAQLRPGLREDELSFP